MPVWRQTLSSLTEFRFFGETTILRRLQLLEPKKRRGRVRWVLFFAVLGVASALMLDASVREWIVTRSRPAIARVRATLTKAPAAAEPAAAPAPSASVEPATWPSVTVAASAPAASAEPVVEAKAPAADPSASATASPAVSASASARPASTPAPRTKPRRKSRR